MTNPIAVSQRARECLAAAYEQAGYRDEAAAFRAGDWTCHDHPALVAMVRFEAEIRADEREKPARMKAAEIESAIATAVRNQKDHDHE